MPKLLNLPIGNASFESIRKNNQLYVDKTRHIFKMADEGMYYFLSRPRRFGKSLTISTLRCLFQGRQDLFEGLWIETQTGWKWEKHPVVLIDFNEISHDTVENLKGGLSSSLKINGRVYGVRLYENLLKEQFKELILALYRKTGMTVVILIDEYDKPLTDHLGHGEKAIATAKANRNVLKYFFGVIKGGEVAPALRFVLLTGVSKFSRVSIFSELNNLYDLTMDSQFADMLGYTHDEIETYFEAHIKAMARERGLSQSALLKKLADHYDGYRFSRKEIRVFNPFSIMCAFQQKELKNYWFETGTPTFLVNLLRKCNYPLPNIERMEAEEETFSAYEIEALKPEALLFQTGYITIKAVDDHIYTFTYPNKEVKLAFQKHLLFSYIDNTARYSKVLRISSYLQNERLNDFFEAVASVFAAIPYSIESKRDEAFFHTIFYLAASGYGIHADCEVLTSEGRIDLVMEFTDKVYVIEFKCDQSADTAIRQIRDMNYARKFRHGGKKIILMGINFDTQKRRIGEWRWEPD